MLRFFGIAALAATLSFVPAAGSVSTQVQVQPAVVAAPAPKPVLSPQQVAAQQYGLDLARANQQDSGLAPGQTGAEFQAWLGRSPANGAGLTAFRQYLAAAGVESVVPLWQLVRTSSSWRSCGAQPFEAPPQDKWGHIVKTLRFVRDEVVPAVGPVEVLSGYRNEELNACSNGAPQSAHRHFFALDLTPVSKTVARADMIRSVCAAHATDGRAYDAGLGFYSGRRFHVDSSGYRKWGPNGRGATSPCVTGYA